MHERGVGGVIDKSHIVGVSPGPAYCFNSAEEDAGFWKFTPVAGIDETIAGKFNKRRDLNELYSKANLTDQKSKYLAVLGDAIVGKGGAINYWGLSYSSLLGFNFANSAFSQPWNRTTWLTPGSSVP